MSSRSFLSAAVLGLSLFVSVVGCGEEPSAGEESDFLGQSESPLWTAFTSEESPPVSCIGARLVAGVACTGRFCDNVAIDCVALSGLVLRSSSSSTPFFSEEGTHEGVCSGNEWMVGLQCHGDFCDNISLRCQDTNMRPVDCMWTTNQMSEENSPFQVGSIGRPGFFIRGMRCFGSNCDNKTFNICRPVVAG
ncbi:hypothetical protein HPC49_29175 [Pyxidicoccus fallax]|uniref:Lipoprotein n=1 Tax=Pyxidicoccus fallax TaxID=394095 RepID=A0A848LJE2_9BACT|nr:hypothetical protein [Pyxidicoccus fallax]NMO17843.1 hypothetical protein [Pyxidicoccus fallax]NPC82278.1 hypothetical protein [Pyxidicoccus fallax]